MLWLKAMNGKHLQRGAEFMLKQSLSADIRSGRSHRWICRQCQHQIAALISRFRANSTPSTHQYTDLMWTANTAGLWNTLMDPDAAMALSRCSVLRWDSGGILLDLDAFGASAHKNQEHTPYLAPPAFQDVCTSKATLQIQISMAWMESE